MPPIRKEFRGGLLSDITDCMGEWDRISPTRGDPEQSRRQRKREHNDSIAVPRPPIGFSYVAQNLHRSAGCRDFLQLALGEERDELAVWRPKQCVCSLGPGRWLG